MYKGIAKRLTVIIGFIPVTLASIFQAIVVWLIYCDNLMVTDELWIERLINWGCDKK